MGFLLPKAKPRDGDKEVAATTPFDVHVNVFVDSAHELDGPINSEQKRVHDFAAELSFLDVLDKSSFAATDEVAALGHGHGVSAGFVHEVAEGKKQVIKPLGVNVFRDVLVVVVCCITKITVIVIKLPEVGETEIGRDFEVLVSGVDNAVALLEVVTAVGVVNGILLVENDHRVRAVERQVLLDLLVFVIADKVNLAGVAVFAQGFVGVDAVRPAVGEDETAKRRSSVVIGRRPFRWRRFCPWPEKV